MAPRPTPPPRPGQPAPQSQPTTESLLVSMDQDEFVAGGLPSDFDGEVIEARSVVWNYDNGNGPKVDETTGQVIYTLAVRLTIKPDTPGEKDYVVFQSAGDPTHFLPSMDGVTPSPADETGCSEGIYFIRQGSKQQLTNNTNYAQFLNALKDAESQAPQLARKREADVRFLEGLYGHWDRIPQKRRAGMVTAEATDAKRKSNDILVCTQLKVKGATAAPAARPAPAGPGAPPPARPAAAPPAPRPGAPTPAAPAVAAPDLDEALQGIVGTFLTGKTDWTPKGGLSALVMSSKALAQPQKAKALTRITSVEFLAAGQEAGLWFYDADQGLLYPAVPAE